MQDFLPKGVLKRPKVGIRVPIGAWFRGLMRNFVRAHIALAGELLNRREIEQVLRLSEGRRQNHEKVIWAWVNLKLFPEAVPS